MDEQTAPQSVDNPTETLSITPVNKKFGELAPSITNDELREQIVFENERREILRDYIKHHLIKDFDYGKIHIARDCSFKANPKNCKNQFHFSKNTLLKPGQEKVMSLFHWIADFKTDNETKQQFSNSDDLVAYICVIYDINGRFVSQGKGACSLEETYGSHNNCIKRAKKRAQADALNSSGVLSDFWSIVDEKENEITAQSTAQNQGTEISVASNCNCGADLKGQQYHSKTCPKFGNGNEVVSGELVGDPESVDDEDLPF